MNTSRAVSHIEELPVNGYVGDLSDEDQESNSKGDEGYSDAVLQRTRGHVEGFRTPITDNPASSAQTSSDGQIGPTYLLSYSPSDNRQWYAFYQN